MKERAVFVDIDDTLIDGVVAAGIGYGALNKSKGIKKLYGATKGLQVKYLSKVLGETWALETLANSLAKAGIIKEDVKNFSDDYIDKKIKKEAPEFLEYASEDADLYILTTGFDIGPSILEEKYNLKLNGKISNQLLYNGNTEVVGSNVIFDNNNIVKRVSQLSKKYQMVDIIDDRPYRYLELNGHPDMAVYNTISDFSKVKPLVKT